MSRCWINRAAYASLVHEANRAFPNETGGVLVGYRSDNGEIVVHEMIGPGPNATHSLARFTPDHVWQCEQLDRLYIASSQNWTYVGDWHTHPHGVPEMSWLDRRTLRGIAKHPQAQTSSPVMMIGGGSVQQWDWKIHEYSSDRLFGLLVTTRRLDLIPFD